MPPSVVPATADDVDEIMRLRREAEDWLEAAGIAQWGRGEVTPPDVRRQVAAAEWHVVHDGDHLAGGLRLLWSDEPVWQAEDAPAAYVHGLMVDRRCAGQRLGGALLAWAGDQGRRAGLDLLRLDCVESNHALRRYYRAHGFLEVGRRDFDGPWFSAVLLERPVTASTERRRPSRH